MVNYYAIRSTRLIDRLILSDPQAAGLQDPRAVGRAAALLLRLPADGLHSVLRWLWEPRDGLDLVRSICC
jgi:hypothetical protein